MAERIREGKPRSVRQRVKEILKTSDRASLLKQAIEQADRIAKKANPH